ncbi:unnamed protein product, partial [Prorocentrum cordatum]
VGHRRGRHFRRPEEGRQRPGQRRGEQLGPRERHAESEQLEQRSEAECAVEGGEDQRRATRDPGQRPQPLQGAA